MTTALTVFAENIAMRNLSAAESTVIYSTEPLWGAAFAAAFLGENFGWNTFAGASLIITACVWSSLGPKMAGIGGVLTSAQVTSQVDKLEEVTENMGVNLQTLIENLQGKSSDL